MNQQPEAETVTAYVARWVKEHRTAADLSYREADRLCGIGYQTLRRLEAGQSSITLETLTLIAKWTGDIDTLLAGIGHRIRSEQATTDAPK